VRREIREIGEIREIREIRGKGIRYSNIDGMIKK
jgi:hypothetical protein